MLKFVAKAAPDKGEPNHSIVLIFTEGNLQLLLDNKPIHLSTTKLGLTEPRHDYIFIAGKDRAEMTARLSEVAEVMGYPDDTKLNVLDFGGSFCLWMQAKDNQVLHLICFDDVSFARLRDHKMLQLRMRTLDAKPGVVIAMALADDPQKMLDELVGKGIISNLAKFADTVSLRDLGYNDQKTSNN